MSKKLQKSYDFVLVGYTLSSLCLAKRLKQDNFKVCIVDSVQLSNNPIKFIPSTESSFYSQFPYIPVNEDWEDNLKSAMEFEPGQGAAEEVSGPPVTFNQGEFKSFIGFEAAQPPAKDEVIKYCSPQGYYIPNQPEDIWQYLEESVEEELFLDQQLTFIEVDEGRVNSLTFNGKTRVQAKQFVFCKHLYQLFTKLGPLNKALSSKFQKVKWWSTANMIFNHGVRPEKAQLNTPYLLMGSKEQPCLGFFHQSGDQTISRWLSFFPAELTLDSETSGPVVKEIKKQLKRAFPYEEGASPKEYIMIHDHACADLSSLPIILQKVSKFEGLAVCSPLIVGRMDWLSEIDQAQQTYDYLKANVDTFQVEATL